MSLAAATKLAVQALGADGGPNAVAALSSDVDALEVAILDRTRACRASSAGSPAIGWPRCCTDDVEPDDPGPEVPPQMPPEPTVPETVVGESP